MVNTFGDWAKKIPEDTIPFEFDIIGIVVEEVSSATTYHIQIGYNPGAGEPGENQEMVSVGGERTWLRYNAFPRYWKSEARTYLRTPPCGGE